MYSARLIDICIVPFAPPISPFPRNLSALIVRPTSGLRALLLATLNPSNGNFLCLSDAFSAHPRNSGAGRHR